MKQKPCRNRSTAIKYLLFLIPFLCVLAGYTLKKISPDLYLKLFNHDFFDPEAPAEWAQYWLYTFAVLIQCASQRTISKNPSLRETRRANLGLTAMVFVISMEEISWGQRIFRWTTPALLQGLNRQNETTLHNISFIQDNFSHPSAYISILSLSFILVGLAGGLGWVFRGHRRMSSWKPLLPPWYLSAYFLLPGAFYASLVINTRAPRIIGTKQNSCGYKNAA